MKKLGSLWIKRDKNSNVYLTGTYGEQGSETKLVVFSNKKTKDTQPDWIIYLSEPKKEREVKDEDVPF